MNDNTYHFIACERKDYNTVAIFLWNNQHYVKYYVADSFKEQGDTAECYFLDGAHHNNDVIPALFSIFDNCDCQVKTVDRVLSSDKSEWCERK
jgi:hypothetical protein